LFKKNTGDIVFTKDEGRGAMDDLLFIRRPSSLVIRNKAILAALVSLETLVAL